MTLVLAALALPYGKSAAGSVLLGASVFALANAVALLRPAPLFGTMHFTDFTVQFIRGQTSKVIVVAVGFALIYAAQAPLAYSVAPGALMAGFCMMVAVNIVQLAQLARRSDNNVSFN